jgi:hypothetical protein
MECRYKHLLIGIRYFDCRLAESGEVFSERLKVSLAKTEHIRRRDLYVLAAGELMDELAMEVCVAGDGVVRQVHIPP